MSAERRTSLALFRFKGITVLLHWSFPLLILWVMVSTLGKDMDVERMFEQLLYVMIAFCCVVLHEFGHALTALRYGIRTRSILLLPIGGVASLERMPEKPMQELVVTLAGPAVNLAIALLAGMVFLFFGDMDLLIDPMGGTGPLALVGFLISVNLALFFFNLIPAFPMDGGRILRSLLAFKMDRVRATHIASTIGKLCAVAIVLAAVFWGQPMLGLIGLFVFFGASAEMGLVRAQQALTGARAKDVMRTRFWSMAHDATIGLAAEELLAGGDHVIVLTRHGAFDRLIPRTDIIAAVQAGQGAQPLEMIPGQVPEIASPEMDVKLVYERLSAGRSHMMPVIERGAVMGVIELDNLTEYVELHAPRKTVRKE